MKYCKECGSELKEDAKFCKECGTVVGSVTPSQSLPVQTPVQSQTPTVQQPKKPRKPLTKKTKISLIAAVVVIILLIGAFKVGAVLTSKDRLVDKFETALNDKDSKAVANLLSSHDKKLKIDEKSVKGLIDYYKKNPDKASVLISDLKAEAKSYDGKDEDMFGSDADGMITLKKDGKFLFYDKYVLQVNPVYLSLYTNYKDTDLYVDGKKVGTSTKQDFEKTYGPFVPGFHDLEAKFKNDYVSLNQKSNNVLLDGSETKQSEDLSLDGEELYVDLPVEDGASKVELYINDKDTGVDLLDGDAFGPIVTDGSITYSVKADLPFGTITTDPAPIDSSEVSVDFMTADLKQSIMDTVVKTADEWVQAYTSGDMSKITTGNENYIQFVKEHVESNKESDYAFKGEYLSTVFDLDSFDLFESDGVWEVNVDVNEKYKSADYYIEDEPSLEENDNYQTYTLVYDEDKKTWLVDSTYTNYGFYSDDDNTKEVKVEKPKMYTSAWAKSDK